MSLTDDLYLYSGDLLHSLPYMHSTVALRAKSHTAPSRHASMFKRSDSVLVVVKLYTDGTSQLYQTPSEPA